MNDENGMRFIEREIIREFTFERLYGCSHILGLVPFLSREVSQKQSLPVQIHKLACVGEQFLALSDGMGTSQYILGLLLDSGPVAPQALTSF